MSGFTSPNGQADDKKDSADKGSANKDNLNKNNPSADKDGFVLGEERPPVIRWLIGFLALAMIVIAAIWLVLKVITPANVPTVEKPQKPKEEVAEQKKTSDDEAWVRALEKDTLDGYREYLSAFPNGKYKKPAQDRINAYDHKAWARAERRNTIAGYEDYLKYWKQGLHADKARERIAQMKADIEAAKKDAAERAQRERVDWERAAKINTIESYNNYLAKHPAGKNAQEARNRIDRLKTANADESAWQAAKTANTANAYQQYLTSFPQGKYTAQAIAAIDNLRPKAGKTFKDCNNCPTMVSIPAGTATLGAGGGDINARPNEKPARPVTFANMFAISVTEITFNDWQACVSGGVCKEIKNDNGWGRGRRPVINVSWDDAQNYIAWLSKTTGHNYSLPSEAQWEYVARGGDNSIYIGGSPKALCAFANGAGSESGLKWANNECSDPAPDRTMPTGSLSANNFGVKDIIGNVAEWTLDCNTLNLRDAPTDGSADGRGSCSQRVTRGGSWFSGAKDLRYTARLMQRRGDRNDFTGFRVVRKIGN